MEGTGNIRRGAVSRVHRAAPFGDIRFRRAGPRALQLSRGSGVARRRYGLRRLLLSHPANGVAYLFLIFIRPLGLGQWACICLWASPEVLSPSSLSLRREAGVRRLSFSLVAAGRLYAARPMAVSIGIVRRLRLEVSKSGCHPWP